ncbi:MAG: hypothetical protein HY079_03090 [Elusimicrobia bacterium]|nr:hypothetical protein [Elusimicrobiota bacterium]
MRAAPTALLAAAGLALSGCFISPDCRAPASETEAFVSAELAAWREGRSDAARLDAAARALGADDARELAALAARDCLEARDAARFAAARGLTAPEADATLARLGVRACR